MDILHESIRFMQTEKRLRLHACVIMENHLHMIATAEHLGKVLGEFKSFTAKSIINRLEKSEEHDVLALLECCSVRLTRGRKYQLWQEGSHPQAIVNTEMMRQKIAYIHNNPVRKGYVDDATQWQYSSARNYAGMEGLLDVEMDW